jgi:hypothetical protein
MLLNMLSLAPPMHGAYTLRHKHDLDGAEGVFLATRNGHR